MSHDRIKADARRRMAKTGEPYQVARREVIKEHKAAQHQIPVPDVSEAERKLMAGALGTEAQRKLMAGALGTEAQRKLMAGALGSFPQMPDTSAMFPKMPDISAMFPKWA